MLRNTLTTRPRRHFTSSKAMACVRPKLQVVGFCADHAINDVLIWLGFWSIGFADNFFCWGFYHNSLRDIFCSCRNGQGQTVVLLPPSRPPIHSSREVPRFPRKGKKDIGALVFSDWMAGMYFPRCREIFWHKPASLPLYPLHGKNFKGKVRSPFSALFGTRTRFLPVQGGPARKYRGRRCYFLKIFFLSGVA